MLGCGWEWFPFPLLPLGRTDAVGVLLTEDVTAVRPIEPRCRLGALDGIQLRDGMFVRVRLCEVGHLLLVPTPAVIVCKRVPMHGEGIQDAPKDRQGPCARVVCAIEGGRRRG